MEFLLETTINVPLAQLLVYMLVITLCFLTGRSQLGLTLNFAFIFYLGFILNRPMFESYLSGSALKTSLYFIAGGLIVLLTAFSFFKNSDH